MTMINQILNLKKCIIVMILSLIGAPRFDHFFQLRDSVRCSYNQT